MNKLIRNCFVVFLVLITGMVWLDAQAAKPVKVTVDSAFPDYAAQGELIDVEIEGDGFDDGSTARFIVTDSRDDTQIDVQSVEYIGPGKLKAKIKVKDAALVIDYDIEVTTSSGRRGKGTTMFQVREKTGLDDPCLTSISPFPAFMFWRNLSKDDDPEFTMFLSSEDGVCVRPLVAVPDTSATVLWYSVLSYDEASNRGLVTWKRDISVVEEEIWLQEFSVSGNTVDLVGEPELVVAHPDHTDMNVLESYIFDVDISPDLQSIVYTYGEIRQEDVISEVHVASVDSCRSPNPPCVPNADTLILEGWLENDDISRLPLWNKVAWGPLDERIYIVERRGTYPVPEPWVVRMVSKVDGEWADQELFNEADYPEYHVIWRMSSGISDGREKLAFRHRGDCRTISVIDVADCEAGPTETNPFPCTAEAQFFGTSPSWTDRGTILHDIIDRVQTNKKRSTCHYSDFIGEWDPYSSVVTSLVEGDYVDAR